MNSTTCFLEKSEHFSFTNESARKSQEKAEKETLELNLQGQHHPNYQNQIDKFFNGVYVANSFENDSISPQQREVLLTGHYGNLNP